MDEVRVRRDDPVERSQGTLSYLPFGSLIHLCDVSGVEEKPDIESFGVVFDPGRLDPEVAGAILSPLLLSVIDTSIRVILGIGKNNEAEV